MKKFKNGYERAYYEVSRMIETEVGEFSWSDVRLNLVASYVEYYSYGLAAQNTPLKNFDYETDKILKTFCNKMPNCKWQTKPEFLTA